MAKYEVTQGEWQAAFGNNPSWFGPNANGTNCGADCPVERVNWFEALAYANWLSEQKGLTPCYVLTGCTGTLGGGCGASSSGCAGDYTCTVSLNGVSKPQECEGYRLPTEAEWEFTIRAGSTTAFYPSPGNNGTITQPTGNDPNLNLIAWYTQNSDTGSGKMTHPVGQKAANAWGLYDMSGNVWEWVWDWSQDAYQNDVATDPVGPVSGSLRVLRGGYWGSYAQYCRSANRGYVTPGSRYDGVGFRLSRSSP